MNQLFAPGTLVLVTDQFACERIIKAARAIADLSAGTLLVLSVMGQNQPTNPEALEHLFAVAKEYGAVMTVTFKDDPYQAIVDFAQENRVINVITGVPNDRGSMLVKLWKNQRAMTFFTVSHEGKLHEVIDREYHSPQINRAVEQYIQSDLCMQEG